MFIDAGRQCHTRDMDMDAHMKVQKEPQGEAEGWPRSQRPE